MEEYAQEQPEIVEQELEFVGTSEQQAALFGALAQAMPEFDEVIKDKRVHYKTKESGRIVDFHYATLKNLRQSTVTALGKYGCSVVQPHTKNLEVTTIHTVLGHKDGGKMISRVSFRSLTNDKVKEEGALLTYHRRYAYNNMLMLDGDVDADDIPDEMNEKSSRKRQAPAPKKPVKKEATEDKAVPPEDMPPVGEPPEEYVEAEVVDEDGPPTVGQKSELNALLKEKGYNKQKVFNVCKKNYNKEPAELSSGDVAHFIEKLKDVVA
jgi:hypothetical protein